MFSGTYLMNGPDANATFILAHVLQRPKAKCMVFKLGQTEVQVVPSPSDPDHLSLLYTNMNG